MMRKNKTKTWDDFGQLRAKILIKTVLLFVAAIICIYVIYNAFLFQKFADPAVSFLNFFIRDIDGARNFYNRYVRTYKELYFLAAISLVFIIILRFYLKNFVKYFNEINNGINSIIDRSNTLNLSPELSAIEKKIIQIKLELEQRERVSREAEQRKDDLVMYLAHDIRTPLTSVIGYLNLINESPEMPVEQQAKYIHIALDKAYSLEKMVNEFFEITRYNVQEMTMQKEPIDLYYMLIQLTDEMSPFFLAHKNTVKLNVNDGLTVFGDPEKLARAFNNVLKNAAAYSFENTEIEISAAQKDGSVEISIKNKGNTIPQDKLSSLFERFYRLDESRSSNSGGTGLGLSIAKEIVLQHGGTIKVESVEDTVIFTIVLPLKFT